MSETIARALRDAYGRGFSQSGEGYNGEYSGDAHEKQSWRNDRDAWIRQYMARMPTAPSFRDGEEVGREWRPQLTGAHQLGRDRKGDVTINIPTALCWLQFQPEAFTGDEDQTRPGVGFSLVAYPDSHGEWPSGVIPRDEAYKLYRMLGSFFDKHSPSVRDRSGETAETLGSADRQEPGHEVATPNSLSPLPDDKTAGMTVEEAREVLRNLSQIQTPQQHIAKWRRASLGMTKQENIDNCLARAGRIETALLTLQSERGDQ